MKTTTQFKAVAILSIALVGAVASILTRDHAGMPATPATPVVPVALTAASVTDEATIQTVTVVGKRMTVAEKALYDQQELRLAACKGADRDNG